jgi:hypothetical protein
MVELKFRFYNFFLALVLVVCCSFLPCSIVYSQQATTKPPATTTVKGKLASEVLSTLGIDRRYDLYFDHAVSTCKCLKIIWEPQGFGCLFPTTPAADAASADRWSVLSYIDRPT